jgi:hypothetical protein
VPPTVRACVLPSPAPSAAPNRRYKEPMEYRCRRDKSDSIGHSIDPSGPEIVKPVGQFFGGARGGGKTDGRNEHSE